MMTSSRVICAISGGVDSAVAAYLLKQKGYNVLGVFMRNWDLRDELGYCNSDEDHEFATRVCKVLNIPFYEVNLVKEYWTNVFMPMIDGYEHGNTPNPDVLCNHYVKFDALHRKCQRFVKDDDVVIATGHYAQTALGERVLKENIDQLHDQRLLKAVDQSKDQTFFLHQITNNALLRTYFPIGDMCKSEVKEIASNSPLSFTLQRKESMGMCFIGRRDFSSFIKDYLPARPGKFICFDTGEIVGEHGGYYVYTVGQRSKLGGFPTSYAVLHKDIDSGNIIVVPGLHHPALYNRSIVTKPAHWINEMPQCLKDGKSMNCQFRFMHRQPLIDCVVHPLDGQGCLLVVLKCPLRALTVGQHAIFYSDDVCLGGGQINDVGPSRHECESHDFFHFRKNSGYWRSMVDKYGEDIITFSEETDENLNKLSNISTPS